MKHQIFNEPMNIIISGVESNTYWDIVVNKCEMQTVLMSYHYLQSKPSDFLKKRLEKHPDVKVFIDSGTHTFLSNADDYVDKSDDFWESYLEDYVDFIRTNKDYIFACADLDIDDIVGIEKIDKWREDYFEPLEKEGVQVCYIWHTIRGDRGWEEMCSKYSYTGFSMQNDSTVTVQRLMKRLNVARRYNTRVHGMALTKTEILTRVPFFSADSTTWLVGQQYGELNWFDGRKMKRLLKAEWRRNFKTKLIKEPFNANWDKLINGMGGRGDTYELLRLNVIAYRLAQEHIRKRLGKKQYWMTSDGSNKTSDTKTTTTPKKLPKKRVQPQKSTEEIKEVSLAVTEPKVTTPNVVNLLKFSEDNQVNYPTKEWFEGECDDYLDYLPEFHIDAEAVDKEGAVGLLYYYYVLLKDDEELDSLDDNELISYAQSLISENITDRKTAIRELRIRFQANLDGEATDFLGNELEPSKERKVYIQEPEFLTRDLTQDEIDEALKLDRPEDDNMPEVAIYDTELKARSIQPVRDGKGRFVKGIQQNRKRKNIYSKIYPKLACDTCYKSGDCPQYKSGYVCAFDKQLAKFDTRSYDDIMDAMDSIVNTNLQRLQKAMIFETMDGGMPTPEVSALIDQNMRHLEKLKQLKDVSPSVIASQKSIVRGDGSTETVTEMSVNPSSGGILSKIFSQHMSSEDDEVEEKPKSKPKDKIIEVDYQDADS